MRTIVSVKKMAPDESSANYVVNQEIWEGCLPMYESNQGQMYISVIADNRGQADHFVYERYAVQEVIKVEVTHG